MSVFDKFHDDCKKAGIDPYATPAAPARTEGETLYAVKMNGGNICQSCGLHSTRELAKEAGCWNHPSNTSSFDIVEVREVLPQSASPAAEGTFSICSAHQTPDPDCPRCNVKIPDYSKGEHGDASRPLAPAVSAASLGWLERVGTQAGYLFHNTKMQERHRAEILAALKAGSGKP